MMKTVLASFRGGQQSYHFLWDGEDLNAGELIVVDSAGSYHLARVVETRNKVSPTANKWVVCKVDVEDHQRRVKKSAELTRLKKQLEAKVKEFEKTRLLTLLIDSDPEAAKIQDRINSLENA